MGAVVLLLLAAVWSGLWLFGSERAGVAFDAWLAAEQQAGRLWTCPDRRIDGYPFRLRIGCTRPTFHGEIAGRSTSGLVEGLRAQASLGHPNDLAIDLRGPLNLRADDDAFGLLASWEHLRLTAPLPWATRQGTLAATRLALTLSVRAEGDFNLRVAHLAGQGEASPDRDSGDMAFAFTAAGVSLPTLDDFTGGGETIAAEGHGALTHADLLTAPTVRRLEAWRMAGGALGIAALTLDKGSFQGRFEGRLGLDEDHRMAGRLDTELSGFEPLAARFGIPLGGLKLGGLLTSLLGGKKASASADPGALRLPLVFDDGRLAIGPFKTTLRIDPLY